MKQKIAIIALVAVIVLTSAVVETSIQFSNAKQTQGVANLSRLDEFFIAATKEPANGTSVLLITIDTLRPDHLGMYGYNRQTSPKMDALAKTAAVYTKAYATAPLTTPSIVSMLTGYHPNRHGVRLLWQPIESDTVTVADHLHRAGYQTAAIVSNIVLGNEACKLGDRFDHYDEAVDEPEPNRPHMLERRASRTTDAAVQWLERHRQADRPFFLWVHYIDPHGPYTPPSDSPMDFAHDKPIPISEEKIAEYVREPGLTDGAEYVDRYDEEIAYTDREVGRLVAAFDALELSMPPLTLLTSDHGENMMEGHAYFSHGYDVNDAVIRIPLIARHPSIAVGMNDRLVSISDIAPTILDIVGLPVPTGLDGFSLTVPSGAITIYAEGLDSGGSGGLHRTLIDAHTKTVIRHGRSNIPRESWAFDLLRDPHQKDRIATGNFSATYRALAAMIRSDPDPGGRPTHLANHEHSHGPVAGNADSKATRALRALGYIE
ncbi:MAG: sulfatase [Planctomycetes bacterium]|nr:sulfatase [Planctomycetota bacterium]